LLESPALVEIAVEDAGIFTDVDTPDDLARLRQNRAELPPGSRRPDCVLGNPRLRSR
jgi:hypothetical protein